MEAVGHSRIAATDHPGRHELGIGVERSPRPHVADTRLTLPGCGLLLHADEAPDFIALDAAQLQVTEGGILMRGTRCTQVHQELEERVLGNARHVAGRTDAVPFHEDRYHLGPFLCR